MNASATGHTTADPAELRRAWQRLQTGSAPVRTRDAAALLGVSEAALVACRTGDGVTRLQGDMKALLRGLEAVGPVMALTRNEHAVHEKHGRYRNLRLTRSSGMVLDEGIDLRIDFRRWHHAFSVTEGEGPRHRRSVQIFDRDGTAVHKVYLTGASDEVAFERLVQRLAAPEQGAHFRPCPALPALPLRRLDRAQQEVLRKQWSALQDTHGFLRLLRELRISRLGALRHAEPEMAWRVVPSSVRRLLETAAGLELPIMIFVVSPGTIQIHSGPIRHLRATDPWFNVLDPGFNLHLREAGIAEAWVVRKPTGEGIVTSLELFGPDGGEIALIFGARKPGQAESREWRHLVSALPRLETEDVHTHR